MDNTQNPETTDVDAVDIEVIGPWYTQFWLWFLVFFPALAVVAGVITIKIAFDNEDSLVRDDYYKAGLAINADLAQDKFAQNKNIQAKLTIDRIIGSLQLNLMPGDLSELPTTLQLDFIHPTQQSSDFSLTLNHSREGLYLGQLEQGLKYRWHIQISDVNNSSNNSPVISWRLKSDLDFSSNSDENLSVHFAP